MASNFYLSNGLTAATIDLMEGISITSGVLSLISSLMVIFTVLKFPSMWTNKIYMQILVMISVSDVISSIAVTFGFPKGTLCTVQGTLIFFGFRASWIWSVLMIYQLCSIVKYGHLRLSFRTMNLICWSLDLIAEFLPLATGTWYANSPDFQGYTVCSISAYDPNFYNWICVVFVGPLNLTVLLLLIFYGLLICRIRGKLESDFSYALVKSVVMYPFIMLLSVAPFLYLFFKDVNVAPTTPTNNFVTKYVTWHVIYCWASMQGFFNAIIFFYNSKEARYRWKHWYKYTFFSRDPPILETGIGGAIVKSDGGVPDYQDFLVDEDLAGALHKDKAADTNRTYSVESADLNIFRTSDRSSTVSNSSLPSEPRRSIVILPMQKTTPHSAL